MAFEDVIGSVMQWSVSIEAAAAVGAELALKQSGEQPPPEVAAALRTVSEATGLGQHLDDLAPPQQALVASLIRMYLNHAIELLEHPTRAPGWTYTDPVILDGWGRGSAMVPAMIAGAAPDLGEVENFLDVGTGVGLLAVGAATVWPGATIVGIDTWEPSLERARVNVTAAGLDDRITLRKQNVTDVDEVDRYDLIWVPTFFLTEPGLIQALSGLLRATRPGGTIVLGSFVPPPDPLAAATGSLRTIRGGGCDLDAKRAVELLEDAGYASVQVVRPPAPMALRFIVGRKVAQ